MELSGSLQKTPEEMKQHLFEKEGDNLMVLQLYEQALISYTKALEFGEQWPTYVSRSRCQVCLGQAQLAVEDARRGLELAQKLEIEDQYKCEYQYAEALYSSGEFEEALLFYYRAFWARPVQNEYRLGIQKAEQAVIRAMNASQPVQAPLQREPIPVLDEELLVTVLQEPEKQRTRCLCGCIGCDVHQCRDLYAAPGQQCICRCSGCVKHLAQRHGLVSDCSGQLISTQVLKQDLGSTASSATPHKKTMTLSQVKTTTEATQEQKKRNIRQMTSLQRDKELIEDLMKDPKLQKICKGLTNHLESSMVFVSNREQFWRQQCTEQEQKSERQRIAMRQSSRARSSRVAQQPEPSYDEIIALMAEAAQLTMEMKLERALDVCAKIEPWLSSQPIRLQSDFRTLKGCAFYEKFEYKLAQTEFEEALKDKDPASQARGARNLVRVYLEQQLYLEAIPLTYELCKSRISPPIAMAADLSARIRCLAETDYPGNKEEIKTLLADLFSILTGERTLQRPVTVVLEDSWQQVQDMAPSFFQENPTPHQMLFNGMLIAAKLAGVNNFGEAERILTLLVESTKEARNKDAERAALRSLAHLYAATGNADAEFKVAGQLKELDLQRAVIE